MTNHADRLYADLRRYAVESNDVLEDASKDLAIASSVKEFVRREFGYEIGGHDVSFQARSYAEHTAQMEKWCDAIIRASHDGEPAQKAVEAVLFIVAKTHGYESYPAMFRALQAMGPGMQVTEYMAQRSKHGGIGR